jgi:hypothetical protein
VNIRTLGQPPARQDSTHRRPEIKDAQGSQVLVAIPTTTSVIARNRLRRLRLLECVEGVRNALG